MAAVKWVHVLQESSLPLSSASLKGLRREDPFGSRGPMIWGSCRLTAQALNRSGFPRLAAYCLLGFDAYGRPLFAADPGPCFRLWVVMDNHLFPKLAEVLVEDDFSQHHPLTMLAFVLLPGRLTYNCLFVLA